jgi:hypothetical protein
MASSIDCDLIGIAQTIGNNPRPAFVMQNDKAVIAALAIAERTRFQARTHRYIKTTLLIE